MLKLHWRFFVLLIILLVISFIRFHQGQIQQDNYLGYASSLSDGLQTISFFDSRLFPGLPFIIFILNGITNSLVISGYLAIFTAFIGSYVILYKLTGSFYSFIPLIFPPIMLGQSTLIATEIPTVFFILLSLYLFKKKNYALAVLVSSFGFWIRIIALIPGLVILVYLLITRGKGSFKYIPYFFLPITLLMLFNLYFFGPNAIFHQFLVYSVVRVNTFGILQIFIDIVRAWRWGWYRILASGFFYFVLSIGLFVSSFLHFVKEANIFKKVVLLTSLVSLAFIYSVVSIPFLENLDRFLVPIFPLFWLLFHDKFKPGRWLYIALGLTIVSVLV